MSYQDQKRNWYYKVLIVDDEEGLQEEFKSAIVEYLPSIKVEIAKDGLEAIEMIDFFRPDLILLDITMPGIDGFEVCKRIKSDRTLNNTKILIMTGMVHENLQEKITEVGATECLMKPIGFEKLFSIIRTYYSQFLLTPSDQVFTVSQK